MIENPNPWAIRRRDRIFVPVINLLIQVLLSRSYKNALRRYINRGIVAEFYQGDRVYPTP